MPKYIFIVMSICQIGGAEQYIYNKSKHLESIGYDVHIFSGLKREIEIPGLRKFQDECLPCVMFLPTTFTEKERRKNLRCMLDIIGSCNGEEVVIESNGIAEALWGELLAEAVNGINLYIDINEYFNFDSFKKHYVLFKLRRKELYGITESSVSKMLDNQHVDYKEHINAACNNVVEDCGYPDIKGISFEDRITIGYLGRMSKSCVPRIADEIKRYIDNNSDTNYNLLFIGTKDAANITYIKNQFSEYKNVNMHFTGSLYPLSRSLLHHVDVFVSTAGSSYVTYYDGIPTIMVHPVEGYAVGILGDDFPVGGDMYMQASKYSISEQIGRVINNEANITFDDSYLINYNRDMEWEFNRQLGFVSKADNSKEYYSAMLIKPSTRREKIYSLFGKILGANKLFMMVECYRINMQNASAGYSQAD